MSARISTGSKRLDARRCPDDTRRANQTGIESEQWLKANVAADSWPKTVAKSRWPASSRALSIVESWHDPSCGAFARAALPNLTPSRRGGVFSAGAWAGHRDDGLGPGIQRADPATQAQKAPARRDAAIFITKLPKAEHDAEPWQAAMEVLLLVEEHGGPTMLARIGVMRVLNRHVERCLIRRGKRLPIPSSFVQS
jgi:hypothetical protein